MAACMGGVTTKSIQTPQWAYRNFFRSEEQIGTSGETKAMVHHHGSSQMYPVVLLYHRSFF